MSSAIAAFAATGFDLDVFTAELERCAQEAYRGCGLYYEIYAERFGRAVDNLMHYVPCEFKEVAVSSLKSSGYLEIIEEANAPLKDIAEDKSDDYYERDGDDGEDKDYDGDGMHEEEGIYCGLTGIESYDCPCGRHP
ncbi:hypothetical protein [Nitrospirillum amazonense]|uniref:hypothetical protein n=1 Tax=Nitrospirillum amazonense TaxID=28077 RepID=UPI002412E28D|nr:hypothetical protein [Nitrospirillum amazonense]MDG3443714.1 hypothetical protein [Nitrospirillum amazonense]